MNLKKILLYVAFYIVPPFIVHLLFIGPDMLEVLETGMCPPAPPDIPAYKCSIGDFYLRMSVGPWAMVANFLIFGSWFVSATLMIIIFRATRALKKKSNSTP